MLQVPATVKIGDREYDVAPPTFGTLLLVSERLAEVPDIGETDGLDGRERASWLIKRARDFGVLPEILATLILGSKHISDKEDVVERRRMEGIRGFFGAKENIVTSVSVFDRLVKEIRDEVSPSQMTDIIPWLIGGLQLSDFFVLTTFLREINLAEPKKVVKKATARGQSSEASQKRST